MTDDQGIFLDTADRIGARLCRDAVWDGERCNWLGAAPDVVAGQWGTVHRSYGPELYAGTSGIALFLAELFTRTEENIYRDVALGATRHALSRISTALRHCFGLYSGIPGISYALARIAVRLNDDSISKHAIRTLESLRDLPPDRTQLDVLNGSAGLVPGVLALREYHSEEWMIDLAIKHGDFLIEMAHRTDAGWSWNTMNQPDDQQIWNLTGLSHGAGGIAWALLELNAVTGESRFREAAENGFSYERHWYDANHAFANPTGNRYDAGDAKLAWERTVAFFEKHLSGN